ncbi:MAG: PatB family C-S lyase [Clostridia bacterium]|nr:PatB family C-S lyase [Clostridia bacterium]
MAFDFDIVTDRRGTGCEKWNVRDGELPMWVADMDFPTAPAVREVIEAKAAHGIFGYSACPDEWYDAYCGWWKDRHGLDMKREWLVFVTGVIPAISTALRRLTAPAEKVAVLTPVYNIFFNCILNNGRVPLEIPLALDRGDDGRLRYSIDWDAFEKGLADPQTSLLIFCNPQNPTGKIWDRETLARVGELCKKYGVTVLADEIHCDLTDPGRGYVPFASVNEVNRAISVTCIAPTKAFNLAGIQTAAVAVPDPFLRHKMWRALNTDDVAEGNAFAYEAAAAAFTKGGEWLDALNAYIRANKDRVDEFLAAEIPEIESLPSESTYLMWIRVGDIAEDSEKFCSFLREKTGLFVCPGTWYHGDGKKWFRLNVACPRVLLEDGLGRLKRGVEAWKNARSR